MPEAMPEQEVKKHVEHLLSRDNKHKEMPVFLGAGCWPHYVPAAVREITNRSEFLTSYTPYQPEISQGMLQALFEYQSIICELTGMDVANSSMYDWASALGEAARMAARIKNRNEILIPKIIHPERKATLRAYTEPTGMTIKEVNYDQAKGHLNLDDLKAKLSEKTAAVYVENPSYLGFFEDQVEEIAEFAHKLSALFVVGVDPTSLGIVKSPGDYEADLVIGEAQPLGNPMSFGGPLLGIMACRQDLNIVRQMPGRIIGMTTTQDGNQRGFCMALQTREQHIRREKATSNICSNEALCAVAAAAYVSLLGSDGVKKLGEAVVYRSNYAMHLLSRIEGIRTPVFDASHFSEFTVSFGKSRLGLGEISERLLDRGVHGGKSISNEFPELGKTSLFCVTEIHSIEAIDQMASALKKILEN